tara:strand:+ start:727 stop:930 length:204 start_codon:yes stop_codon:yes gene_type:complete
MFLGDKLLEWLLLAFGSAMFIGNLAALLRPPKTLNENNLHRAPLWRSLIYIIVGLVVAVWSLAGLID